MSTYLTNATALRHEAGRYVTSKGTGLVGKLSIMAAAKFLVALQ